MTERTIDLGVITAYGNARDAGYTGTKEEFSNALKTIAEYPIPPAIDGTYILQATITNGDERRTCYYSLPFDKEIKII